MAKKHPADTTTATVALTYVGPAGQTSPVFGALTPGTTYQTADADFAAYLATTHPDYWRRTAAAKTKE